MKFERGDIFDICISRIKASIVLSDLEKEKLVASVERNRGGFGNGK